MLAAPPRRATAGEAQAITAGASTPASAPDAANQSTVVNIGRAAMCAATVALVVAHRGWFY